MSKCYQTNCDIQVDKDSDLYPFCSEEHHKQWADSNYKKREDKFDRVMRKMQELKKIPPKNNIIEQDPLPIPLVFPKVPFRDE